MDDQNGRDMANEDRENGGQTNLGSEGSSWHCTVCDRWCKDDMEPRETHDKSKRHKRNLKARQDRGELPADGEPGVGTEAEGAAAGSSVRTDEVISEGRDARGQGKANGQMRPM